MGQKFTSINPRLVRTLTKDLNKEVEFWQLTLPKCKHTKRILKGTFEVFSNFSIDVTFSTLKIPKKQISENAS